MAKRKTSKAKKSKAKKSKAKKPTLRKSKARKAKSTAKRKAASRKKVAAKKRRPARRSEADMSWSEVRAARRRKGEGRESRIVRDFERAVNMTPQSLEKWLTTSGSLSVGTPRSAEASETVGHWSGRRIVEIKRKKAEEYSSADYAHMRKVAAYVKRHRAQRPKGEVKDTNWRYSLMNWGHDPLK